ncbi:MAG TPA: glutaminase A [Rectinemataceae bacterium]|nr:glutaminase A [Rectinemataceae bacterium]
MQDLLDRLVAEARKLTASGRPATYIPALAGVNPSLVGIAVADGEGRLVEAGDSRRPFSIQSVSKALSLALVLETRGEEAVFTRVGREPTGDPFNSIIRLETSRLGKPFNPLINAGAIVVSSLLPGKTADERIQGLLSFIGKALDGGDGGNSAPVEVDRGVALSESETGFRNRSIAWFLKERGLIEGDVDEALATYFSQCAIRMDAASLARIGAAFAFDGLLPGGSRLMAPRHARIVKSLMMTCGLYDGSGDFGVEAGLPAKSGVGGGILAAAKARFGIATFGPALDERGNSLAGISMLTSLSRELDLFEL